MRNKTKQTMMNLSLCSYPVCLQFTERCVCISGCLPTSGGDGDSSDGDSIDGDITSQW